MHPTQSGTHTLTYMADLHTRLHTRTHARTPPMLSCGPCTSDMRRWHAQTYAVVIGHAAPGGCRQEGRGEEVCADVQPADQWQGGGPGHQPQLHCPQPLWGCARPEAQGNTSSHTFSPRQLNKAENNM